MYVIPYLGEVLTDKTLIELVTDIQNGNQDSLESIINKFKPIICKLARKLGYEEAETDLIIVFIPIVRSLNLENFRNVSEGALVNYLYNSLKDKAIDLFRKYVLNKKDEVAVDLDFSSCNEDINSKIFIDNSLNSDILTNRQRTILKQSYLYEYSDKEIGEKLHISRQTVNKHKNRGIILLRKYLESAFYI